ncbi:MAG: four helix bundle protein [Bacteroidetes bacterium]|nr:MAG: four helix bundle protein [Bacteroidota bacterium]
MADFRFEDLDIWKDSIEITDILYDYADSAESQNKYRYAEQLRGAALSISNNIAEGSGSFSNKEFAQFLNYARRSLFECTNIIVVFERRKLITKKEKEILFRELKYLSQRITNFRKSLLK